MLVWKFFTPVFYDVKIERRIWVKVYYNYWSIFFFIGFLLFGNLLWLKIEIEFHRPGNKIISSFSPLSKWIHWVQILNLSSYKYIILLPRCYWCIQTTGVE
jgi:hypothetical protein